MKNLRNSIMTKANSKNKKIKCKLVWKLSMKKKDLIALKFNKVKIKRWSNKNMIKWNITTNK